MTTLSGRAITACRACGGALSIPFCDLGVQPVANSYVAVEESGKPDPVFPLNVRVCERCKLAQLDHVVDAGAIFSDYAYLSSVSASWLAHAKAYCESMIQRLALDSGSFVVEVASNDGYLLKNFVAAGIPCLGIEPAANVAAIAVAAGVPTEARFFGRETAAALLRERRRSPDLIVANNVLAHVPDVEDFVAGLALLAGDKGVVTIEAPLLVELVKNVQFDTIYHEHYAYWSLLAAERVLGRHGLAIFDVERLTTHGGSLRLFARRTDPSLRPSQTLEAIRKEEAEAGLDQFAFYDGFEPRVRAVLDAFRSYLKESRAAGRRVTAYGAAAKGNTFLNAVGATADDITLVADANPLKQGRLLPGSRIPIVSPDDLLAAKPDDIVILPWNIAPEIMRNLSKGWKGRFVTAIPSLRIHEGPQ
ncbi:class I SAM-dependent methyltransferase [Microvirga terricola]|uniref:Class I SAM-dependent methyltransferase n=1 Tax=Microvirga terricola TaxID=2719797 RepID=A0ABX0VDK3_9HYPH|nr:class I SAM-dependent methyltransferase [Microvirga terricola]NIX77546.1 class I SAM-dependent methyltransferase [Microvirga terricola]